MNRILSIQDLSCLGKCSTALALPVLSAMGCSCSVLPTAVLSTHTAFPGPHIRSLTEDILPICRHWQSVGAEFDTILIGYLSDAAQAEAALAVAQAFPAPLVLDPVLGDGGRCYSGIDASHVEAMKSLCKKADVLLPNVTEAALLTGLPYAETEDPAYYTRLLSALKGLGAAAPVITGAALAPGKTGFVGLTPEGTPFSYQTRKLPRHCHGTGDLFSAVTAGALVLGQTLPEACALAAGFVERVVSATRSATPFGVSFEPHLPWLWQKLLSPGCPTGLCPGF